MAGLVQYLALIAAVCAVFPLLEFGMRLLVGDCPAWSRWVPWRGGPAERAESPPSTPIGVHERELARLAAIVAATYVTSQPARAFRVTAATGAYDVELVRACRTLGLEAPDGRPPLPPQVRFETESRLLTAGLRW